MWKDSERAKKRQKTGRQPGGKVAIGVATGAAAVTGEEAIKDKEGGIWDKQALDILFNKIVQYLVVNSYVFAITEFHIW